MIAVIGGIVALVVGFVLLVAAWWEWFVIVLLGCIPVFLILGGVIAIAAGIVSIKDSMAAKKIVSEESFDEEPEVKQKTGGSAEEKAE
ncbi:hypothetical protein JW877_04800 [bacterium]|nr:hypothetical protein [bacterium]